MQDPILTQQLKTTNDLLKQVVASVTLIANKKEAVPSWLVALGGSIVGFLTAVLSDPIKQSLLRSSDREKLYSSLENLHTVARTIDYLRETIEKPILFEESRAEITAAWEDLKKKHLELLAMLNFDMFTYYHDVARDRFYALREWGMLTFLFEKGLAMSQASNWTQASLVAREIREDTDGALQRGELSERVFRKCKSESWDLVRGRITWAQKHIAKTAKPKKEED